MQKINRIIVTVSLVLVSVLSLAQNNTNSPYTRFGYGEIADIGSGKSASMGGTSIGIRSESSINAANPAAYTAMDSLTFLFEIGGSGRLSQFSNSEGASSSFTGNLEYINMQLPLSDWLALSAGLLPYSFVGYNISQEDSILQTSATGDDYINYLQVLSGEGTLTQAYFGLSTELGKHFSVGVNASYLFGTLENNNSLSFLSTALYGVTSKYSELRVRDVNFRYGLQYFADLNKKTKLTLGAVFESKSKLYGEYTVGITGVDTIVSTSNSDFESPLVLGAGFSLEFKDKLLVGADFLLHNFSDTKFFGVSDSLKNKYRLAIGAEYLPNVNSKRYLNRVTYRIGGNFTNNYLDINKNAFNYGITFGFGLPAKGNKSIFNIGVEYGRVGRISDNFIQEDYWKFSLSTTFNERWFFKRQFE